MFYLQLFEDKRKALKKADLQLLLSGPINMRTSVFANIQGSGLQHGPR